MAYLVGNTYIRAGWEVGAVDHHAAGEDLTRQDAADAGGKTQAIVQAGAQVGA